MANDDYFKILFLILNELYGCLKEGKRVNLNDISPSVMKIPDAYWLSIVKNACDKGYINGPIFRKTKAGLIAGGLEEMEITMDGVEYLQENAQMKKVYSALKELRDWIPVF